MNWNFNGKWKTRCGFEAHVERCEEDVWIGNVLHNGVHHPNQWNSEGDSLALPLDLPSEIRQSDLDLVERLDNKAVR